MPFGHLKKLLTRFHLTTPDSEDIFTEIFHERRFGGKDSVSGPGSELSQTGVIAEALPRLVQDFHISSILDIPCGDFHWMSRIDLSKVSYIGADIVKEIVESNRTKYDATHRSFAQLNIMTDALPAVDLVLCRDCLVHFCGDDILLALRNICQSKSQYLLTTTFTSRAHNQAIRTGQWRPVNLEAPPWSLPPPLKLINENCTENEGIYADKSLGLWRISDLQGTALKQRS